MVKKGLVTMALFCSMSTITLASSDSKKSDEKIRDGKTVYAQSCAVCHSKAFIPEVLKLGNKEDWKELIEEGQQFPTAHGWVGTRKMPRHGGDPKITLDEFINAVAYMGNQAGANWKESDKLDKAMYKEILKEIQIRLQRNDLYDKIGKKY
ncbi:MAG: c-type cytochrome [Sulfurimonadaceae bacterium]|jgi:cytochrome c5